MSDREEVRTRFLALVSQDPALRLHDLVGQFPASYAEMFNWRKAYFESLAMNDIASVIDPTELAKAQAERVNELALDALKLPSIATINGELRQLAKITVQEALEESLQVAALTLTTRITKYCTNPELDSRDFATLATALTAVNNSFFAKPQATVGIVNNVGGTYKEFVNP